MKYLRWLLFPFSLIYGFIVIIRNWFYDAGLFKSYKFNKPVISVGNLDVGGAGKSPMTEYLIRLLKKDYKIATLSRGYGRETKGYLLADSLAIDQNGHQLASQIGDEPAQFKQKFPDITVAVCEKRVDGIKHLIAHHDIILLDDAYQHRAVEPGLSILLFDYSRINEPHLLLPAGNLREPYSGIWRTQVIIVTKCPESLGEDMLQAIAQKVKPLPYQSLFFTKIAYQAPQYFNGSPADFTIDGDTTVFLLTGIANATPLVKYLNTLTTNIIHHKYPDHHQFTLKNIVKLAAEYKACTSQKKIILTTEKDEQRLDESWFNKDEKLPVFVIPIRAEFLNNSKQDFDQLIIDYVREY
ncbi:tetraacyldisaccharide 4'-kinase [Mucilaginibacter sp. X4EP1]|uniref:tetraacyldisaccharide 4'-kinase n=1 Tax=Mucilaginibacter sp. X4EP1 TaxID=2723092 RepID=UPI002168B0E7|nr:tetraacyldisaccharide 4'-kinase [Mucilaginibacter sp. X4EP1]MCS3816328.1 tetraacyldisaccharide 4'-kinase [Mucilaginibacter sp. X4EP1]